MKDILSMLQSRIDKRANKISASFGWAYGLQWMSAQQKLDKQLMAEVVFLRRELRKEESRREALHNFHLDLLNKHKTLIENLKKKLKVE